MPISCRLKLTRTCLLVVSVTLLATSLTVSAPAANGSVAYTYDALGRILTASYDTGVCVIYSYDANGNRVSQTVLVGAIGDPGVWGCFNWGQRNWGP